MRESLFNIEVTMSFIITITNEKGGVAKTTTTLSLGAALVEMGNKVLVIDLDAQANLTLALGFDPRTVTKTAANLFAGTRFDSLVMETGVPDLFLLPSNHEISYAERFLPSHPGYETLLRNGIAKSEIYDFDYILIDCPPFLGSIVLNAFTAANLLIIPTQPEYFSIYALKNMMGLIHRVRAQSNPDLSYRLLLTMFDGRNRIHRTLSDQLRASFSTGVMETVIMVDTKLRESTIAGLPIIYHSPKSRSALQFRELSQEIIHYVKEAASQPA
jgi:chromosome partitioning protein